MPDRKKGDKVAWDPGTLYVRRTDERGRTSVGMHAAWNIGRLLDSMQAAAAAAKVPRGGQRPKVSRITRAEYLQETGGRRG